MNAKATQKLGVGFLDTLNSGRLPGYAMGGIIGSGLTPAPMRAALFARSSQMPRGNTYNIHVGGAVSERDRRQTANQVASTLRQQMASSARTGIAA
jgi:hypothetical protein